MHIVSYHDTRYQSGALQGNCDRRVPCRPLTHDFARQALFLDIQWRFCEGGHERRGTQAGLLFPSQCDAESLGPRPKRLQLQFGRRPVLSRRTEPDVDAAPYRLHARRQHHNSRRANLVAKLRESTAGSLSHRCSVTATHVISYCDIML